MKFKKAIEYAGPQPINADISMPPIKPGREIIEAAPLSVPLSWECIGCVGKAVVLHKGTAYCRRCYDDRNYHGKLID